MQPVLFGYLPILVFLVIAGGIAIAMVEQNAAQALEIADRASILVDGRNNRDGVAAVLAADPEIRRIFLGSAPTEQP